MSRLIVLVFIILPYCAAFPNCCFDITNYSDFLSSFPCNFICTLKDEILENSCVSCLERMLKVQDYSAEPVISCQDLFFKEEKFLGRVLLTWSLGNVTSPSVFLIEVRNSTFDEWNVVGMTHKMTADIQNLKDKSSYQFRITPFVKPNFILNSLVSERIFIPDSNTPISAPWNIAVVNFRVNKHLVDATLEWNPSKDNPCSYIVYWFPVTDDGLYGEKIISKHSDTLSAVLPELSFQTNYTVQIKALDPSRSRKVNFVDTWFVTPSCITLTGGNYTLCAPDSPLNLSVSWIPENKAKLTWFPPRYTSVENMISGYHLNVIEAADKHHVILKHKESFNVEKDVLNMTLSDLKPSIFYVFEVRAVSRAGTGHPAVVEFTIAESSPQYEPLDYVPWHYIVPSLVFAFIIIIAAVLIHLCHLRMRSSNRRGYPSGTADIPDHLRPFLVQTKSIELQNVIGQGEFGVVHKGFYSRKKNKEAVAVKVLPAESMSRNKMLIEVGILQIIGRHPNIVGLIGFSLDIDKMYLVLEYCALGNLHSRLRKLKRKLVEVKKRLSDPNQPLLKSHKAILDERHGMKLSLYIYQIALGMEHISSLRMVHRDLAARNILLSSEKQVKIADFGLSRDIYETQSYVTSKHKRLPLRWMAPESLENYKFTISSDVWSFGVLMWEVFKFGKIPYEFLRNSDILPYLTSGNRLPKPQAASQDWYNLMLECWNSNPDQRPTFRELVKKTESILNKLSHYTVVIDK